MSENLTQTKSTIETDFNFASALARTSNQVPVVIGVAGKTIGEVLRVVSRNDLVARWTVDANHVWRNTVANNQG